MNTLNKVNELESLKFSLKEQAYDLIDYLVTKKSPFKLYLLMKDDWDKPLPEKITSQKATVYMLDISAFALEESFVNKDGIIVLKVAFENDVLTKLLSPDEVYAVESNIAQIFNDFIHSDDDSPIETNDLLNHMVDFIGIKKEDAKRSLEVFKGGDNPEIFV
jgi:hypothetical protein